MAATTMLVQVCDGTRGHKIFSRCSGLSQYFLLHCLRGKRFARALLFNNGVCPRSTPIDERAYAVPTSERHRSFVFAY